MEESVSDRLSQYGYGDDATVDPRYLVVPELFQRQLKPRRWDVYQPVLFGRVRIAMVGDEPWVVDGQHRVDAAVRNGETTVPVILHRAKKDGSPISPSDAAAMFNILNSTAVHLRAADEFRAACVSDDAEAAALDQALLARGLDGWCRGRSERDLTAISSLRLLVTQLGMRHALYTIDVLRDIWPWPEVVGSPHVRTVRGFGQFLRPVKRVTGKKRPRRWNPDNREMLVSYMARYYPGDDGLDGFLARAQLKRLGGGGGGGSLGMEMLLGETLNKARKAAREAAREAVAASR